TATAAPELSPPSLHDALPISSELARTARGGPPARCRGGGPGAPAAPDRRRSDLAACVRGGAGGARARLSGPRPRRAEAGLARSRSEEHTSELQSRGHLVCRLL